MKFIMFLFLGSMAFDMIVKNVFPTTNTGDPKEVLKQATPIPNDPSENLQHQRHDSSEVDQYAYLSSEEGGVRIVDHSEGREINVDSEGEKNRRQRLADYT